MHYSISCAAATATLAVAMAAALSAPGGAELLAGTRFGRWLLSLLLCDEPGTAHRGPATYAPGSCSSAHASEVRAQACRRGEALGRSNNFTGLNAGAGGFAVVRGFLNSTELRSALDVFEQRFAPGPPSFSYFTDQRFRDIRLREIPAAIRERLSGLLEHFQGAVPHENGPLFLQDDVDFVAVDPSDDLSTRPYRWHQDCEYGAGDVDGAEFLQFRIAVLKEKPEDANVGVAPFDAMRVCMPGMLRATERTHCGTFLDRDERPQKFAAWPTGAVLYRADDDRGGAPVVVEQHLQDLVCAPVMEAGDVLVLRKDSVHRTMPYSSRRLTLTVKAGPRDKVVSRRHLLAGSLGKLRNMRGSNGRLVVGPLALMTVLGVQKIHLGEIHRTYGGCIAFGGCSDSWSLESFGQCLNGTLEYRHLYNFYLECPA